jgi:hypothetical protein
MKQKNSADGNQLSALWKWNARKKTHKNHVISAVLYENKGKAAGIILFESRKTSGENAGLKCHGCNKYILVKVSNLWQRPSCL